MFWNFFCRPSRARIIVDSLGSHSYLCARWSFPIIIAKVFLNFDFQQNKNNNGYSWTWNKKASARENNNGHSWFPLMFVARQECPLLLSRALAFIYYNHKGISYHSLIVMNDNHDNNSWRPKRPTRSRIIMDTPGPHWYLCRARNVHYYYRARWSLIY